MTGKRVLIVNKFLYPRGGDCIVALSTADLLRREGYEVALWGMDYPDNLPQPLSDTFAPQVSFSSGSRLAAVKRVMGVGDVRRAFAAALERFRPDTVHFHNIHSYLSPAIVGMARRFGARTVWTMHDYKLLCPAYVCTDPDGRPCTACFDHPWSVVNKRCMKGNLGASLMGWAEARRWPVSALCRVTDMFVSPSAFMTSMLVTSGVPYSRITTICNALDPAKETLLRSTPADSPRSGIVYAGRLSREKGIDKLLEAVASMPEKPRLSIYGDGPLAAELKERYASRPNIRFMGHTDAGTIVNALATAEMAVCPSMWYENNPLSVIEALSAGTPVLGADMGGIPELISRTNGMLYDPHDPGALVGALRGMMIRSFDNASIKAEALGRFSADTHLRKLLQIL